MPETNHPLSVDEFIKLALLEDTGDGDHTSLACINATSNGKAVVIIKEAAMIAGIEIAKKILLQVDKNIIAKTFAEDGQWLMNGSKVMELEGNIQSILKAERLLLNIMQRMSGIATSTNHLMKLIEGTNAKLLDTRKTTPNFRQFEKLAVKIGGGINHRFGLYDMILIKDNHIDACGGITYAIKKANDYLKQTQKNLQIEIETRNLNEVKEVLSAGNVHRIMLDNFKPEELDAAVQLINHRFETEASGGITEQNIKRVAQSGVDFISVGALTHSYTSIDISLKILK